MVFAPATEGSGRGARLVLIQINLVKSSDFVQEGQPRLEVSRKPIEGWDFSYIKDRKNEEKEPWDYGALAKELVQKSKSVLDMGTGGGEIFSSLAPFPNSAVAIEGYKLNVKVVRKRLEPLGVKVVEVDESDALPFADGEFDLVLNRNSAFTASEVFRILRAGETF